MRTVLLALIAVGILSLQTAADAPAKTENPRKGDRRDKKDEIKQALDDTHMVKALAALQEAKVHLEAARHVYGGHRSKALNNTNEALEEMQKAKRFIEKEIKEEIKKKK